MITILIFVIIYKGVIHGIPNMLNILYEGGASKLRWLGATVNLYLPFIVLSSLVIGLILFSMVKNNTIKMYVVSLLMIFVGFSTYSTIFIRATQHPTINENNPDSYDSFLYYMNREQYGKWSILNEYYLPDTKFSIGRDESAYWKRWTVSKNEEDFKDDNYGYGTEKSCDKVGGVWYGTDSLRIADCGNGVYDEGESFVDSNGDGEWDPGPSFSEQFNYFWDYQIKEMYLRYFAWQFIGKAELDEVEWSWELRQTDGSLIKRLQGINPMRYFVPFAFIFGLIGIIFHFIEDRRRAFSLLLLFLLYF